MNNITSVHKVCLRNKIKRSIWNITYSLLFRPFGTKLFNPWRILLLKIFGAKIHWDSGVYSNAKIWAPWNLTLGHRSWIGPYVVCYNQDIIEIGNDITISQYTYLCTAGHQTDMINNPHDGLLIAPIIIKDKAWLATYSYINMGVTIGEGAVVGARAAVFKDVEPWTVVGGNPAKFIKKRELKDEK